MTDGTKDTALGLARTRFVDSLAKKSDELKPQVAEVQNAPGPGRAREELRRRLHTLYASAQVFHLDELANVLKDATARLDRASEESRVLSAAELYELNALPARIAEFGPPRQPSLAPAARVQRLVQTLTGMPPVNPSTSKTINAPSFEGNLQAPRVPKPTIVAPASPAIVAASLPSIMPASAPSESRVPSAPIVPTISTAGTNPSIAPDAPTSMTPATSMAPPARQSIAAIQTVKRAFRARRPSGSFTARRAAAEGDGTSAPGALNQPIEARVISVLVIDSAEIQAEIRNFLSTDHYEVLGARDPEEALRLARSSAPDVVLADAEIALRPGVELIARLRNDPLTDFVPVVLLLGEKAQMDSSAMHELGADDAITKPLQAATMMRVLSRATSAGDAQDSFFSEIGDATVGEIVERLAAELRLGLEESVQVGKDVKIPVGDGAELLAAAWSTIARARAELAMRSRGRVLFRDVPRRGGPAVLALVDEDSDESVKVPLADVSIEKKRILIVDDDASIVWFFAGLLREAGADVIEAGDGRAALEKIRARRVDLVISDILMPEIDGFALCREMRRDPALADIPVILLSWKEDLLQRMRDLQSGANGYLRKESGSTQILSRVKQLLRPLVRLEAELRAGGEVRGSLDRVGVITLLRTVSRERPNARLTLRDAWNLFEIDVRDGKLVDLTRTAIDGSFSRGAPCVPQLLGATSGRFTVVESTASIRGSLDRPLEQLLEEGVQTLGAMMDSVSSTGLSRAVRISFNEDVLSTMLQASPPPVVALVERMKHGASPRDLLMDGEVAPQTLEGVLIDLARRGALRAVRGLNGEDCVAEALHARRAHPGTLFGSEPPPGRRSKVPAAPSGNVEAPSLATLAQAVAAPEPVVPATAAAPSVAVATSSTPSQAPMKTDSQVKRDLDELFPEVKPRVSSAPPPAPIAPTPTTTAAPASPASVAPSAIAAPAIVSSSGSASMRPESLRPKSRPPVEVDGGISGWVWVLLVVALGVLGFFGYRAIQSKTQAPSPREAAQAPTPPAAHEGASAQPAAPTPPAPGVEDAPAIPVAEAMLAPLGDDPRFGRTEPTLVDTHIEVGENQGLLVVPAPAHAERVTLLVDGHEIGAAPVKIAVDQGGHEIELRHDDVSTFAYVVVPRAGSRILPVL